MIQIRNILVPIDFSGHAEAALAQAFSLARWSNAHVHVLHAEVMFAGMDGTTLAPGHDLATARQHLRSYAGDRILAWHLEDVTPFRMSFEVLREVAAAPAIVSYAEQNDIDVIVMGTHGRRGWRRLMLGSVTEEVVQEAPCPVLTVHGTEPQPRATMRSILVPYDFSTFSEEALRYARALADVSGARIDLLHVVEEAVQPAFYEAGIFSIYDVMPDIEQKTHDHMKMAYELQGGQSDDAGYLVRRGIVAHEIAEVVSTGGYDLVVMATHGLRGLERVLMGSVCARVVRTATCPVLTFRPSGRSARQLVSDEAADALP